MTPDEIAVVRGELEAIAPEVFEPFARKDQRRWGQVYLRGLLTDGQRKSVEPMAPGSGLTAIVRLWPISSPPAPGTRRTSGPSWPGGWRR
ncbi:transposase [Streptomyces bobili]|uniref:transposase n=1 Tax=Streptomyces bobili TaxID=67280 RepID=UPI0033B48981